MTDLDRLLAIEGVKKAKATYCYALDTKRWDLLATVFTRDAVVDFRGGRDLKPGEDYDLLPPVAQALAEGDITVARGNVAIAAFMRSAVSDWVTVHHGALPIIEITSADTATAIWPMFDLLDSGKDVQTGYGHYHDRYRREDGVWRIQTMQVTRLRIEGEHPLHGPRTGR
jgi:hypothetical protein